MARNFSQTHRDKISAKQKDAWKDPTKRVEQKKRIEAKKVLKAATSGKINSPGFLNIEAARQAIIDEIKKLDGDIAQFELLVQKRDKLSSILEDLNDIREGQSL